MTRGILLGLAVTLRYWSRALLVAAGVRSVRVGSRRAVRRPDAAETCDYTGE